MFVFRKFISHSSPNLNPKPDPNLNPRSLLQTFGWGSLGSLAISLLAWGVPWRMELGILSPKKTAGCKRWALPLKIPYFIGIGSSNVKMVADRHRHAAYHNMHCTGDEFLRNVNVDDLE